MAKQRASRKAARRRPALSPKTKKWIGRKIRFLIKKERRSQKQAVAIAYSMARKRGFKVPTHPKHRHRPRRKMSQRAEQRRFLASLRKRQPWRVPKDPMNAPKSIRRRGKNYYLTYGGYYRTLRPGESLPVVRVVRVIQF